MGAWSLQVWAEGLPRVRATAASGGSLALLAWDTGLREEAAGPVPGLPVQVGTAGLSSSLLVQGQIQDEVVPSLLSG